VLTALITSPKFSYVEHG